MRSRDNHWLIRVAIADKPGALASLATTLSVHDVNLLRIDVVSRDGTAVDDLWVELPPGGRIDSLDVVLRRLPGVTVHGVLAGATPDDPVNVMAGACASLARAAAAPEALDLVIEGACLVGLAQHAALLRVEGDASVTVLASSFEAAPLIAAHEPSIAREAVREGIAVTLPGSYPWAPPTWINATTAAAVAAVPLANDAGVYACLTICRSHAMAFEGGELARLAAFGGVITAALARYGLTEPAPPAELLEAVRTPESVA